MEKMAALLIAAHAIADFGLQPVALMRRKRNLLFLALHATIHAALAYVFVQAWGMWQVPLLVFVSHALIDFVKTRVRRDTAAVFVIDQAAHVLALVAFAWFIWRAFRIHDFDGAGYKPLIATAGFAATVQGAGFLIAKFAARLTKENGLELDGLVNGGKLIGQLERALIFLFIFIGQPAAIGFLVAAKSILRFEEAKKQKLAEYVLIGTLLSFSLAVALASATTWAMGL